MLPRARRENLVVEAVGGEDLMVLDPGLHEVHRLSPAAALVWRCCDGRTTVTEMAGVLERELRLPANEELVRLALRQLEREGLLREPLALSRDGRMMSRREAIVLGIVSAAAVVVWPACHMPDGSPTQLLGPGALLRCLPATYAAPAYPVPLRTFYIDAASGSDANSAAQAQNPATPWKTVGKFNANASAGDRGYFQGTFALNDSIRPSASGTVAHMIVYEAWPGKTVKMNGSPANGVGVWLDGRSYIVVKNIDFTGMAIGGGFCVQMDSAGGAGSHNWIQGCTLDGVTEGQISGVLIRGFTDCRVEDCIIKNIGARSGNAGDGIDLWDGSHRTVLVRNTISQCGHMGITVGDYQTGSEATCDDCVVAQNIVRNAWSGNISTLGKANRVLVECNAIADAGTNTGGFNPGTIEGISLKGVNGTFRFNFIWNCAGKAISLETLVFNGFTQVCTGNAIYGNTAWSCGWGLHFAANDNSNVTTNMQNNAITNNLFWNCNKNQDPNSGPNSDVGGAGRIIVRLTSGSNGWPAGSLNGNLLRNNRFAGTGDSLPVTYFFKGNPSGSTENLTLAQLRSTYSQATNNQGDASGNPSFVNAVLPNPDLRLQPTSNAIDQGFIFPGWVRDTDFLGVAPDLGAYEQA